MPKAARGLENDDLLGCPPLPLQLHQALEHEATISLIFCLTRSTVSLRGWAQGWKTSCQSEELLAAAGDGALRTPRLVSPALCQVRTAALRVPDRTRHVTPIPVVWDPRQSHSPLLGTLDYLFRL